MYGPYGGYGMGYGGARVDVDGDGIIGLQDASSFFAGALLPPASMNSIWGACSQSVALPVGPNGACMAITRATFMQALLLISASQQGVFPLTPSVAVAAAPLPPPAFIALSPADCSQYETVFASLHQERAPPGECAKVFAKWGTTPAILNAVWALADRDHDNALSVSEFIIAMALLSHASRGMPLPSSVPATVLCSIPGMHSAQRNSQSPTSPIMASPQMQPQASIQQSHLASSMPAMRVSHTSSNSFSGGSFMNKNTLSFSGSSGQSVTSSTSGLLSGSSSSPGLGVGGDNDIAELERQLQEARQQTAQLRAAQKNATASTSELVLQRTEAENTLRTLQEQLASMTKTMQAEDSAEQQAMGMVRDASNSVSAAQMMQQQLQEQQNKQTERMEAARVRAEQLTNEAAQLRMDAERIANETEALKQQTAQKKEQEAKLGDLKLNAVHYKTFDEFNRSWNILLF